MRENAIIGASIVAAVTASLCCIGPLAATLLGIGSFGAAAVVESWRPYLLGITFALLAAGFYSAYRKREVACADGTCAVSRVSRRNRVMLWIATGVVILFAAFPYYSSALLAALHRSGNHRDQAHVPTSDVKVATTTIQVEGMTCGGCAASVQQALAKREGVKSVEVSLEKKQAIVTYDPAKVTPKQLAEAINQTGFKAKL